MARVGILDPARVSVCFGLPSSNDVALPGDVRYAGVLSQYYGGNEAVAEEKAIALKLKAADASHEEFWELLCAGIADIFDAQCSFISTRVTHDRSTGRELPAIGEQGSYLNGLGLYFNDPSKGLHEFDREVLYKAWNCPCAGMKHGKVFIIHDRASEFNPGNPNATFLPFEIDSYIGLPCTVNGVTVGHFGMIWNPDGVKRRTFKWPFIESILHTFEDLVRDRIMRHIGKDGFTHWRSVPAPDNSATSIGTFRPHAQLLSHELRTPMQGVLGAVELIEATLKGHQDGAEPVTLNDLVTFLHEHCASMRESSSRAFEATENIIEAYKLDMGLPRKAVEVDTSGSDTDLTHIQAGPRARRLSASLQSPQGKKRKRADNDFHFANFRVGTILHPPGPASRRADQLEVQEAVEATANLTCEEDRPSEQGGAVVPLYGSRTSPATPEPEIMTEGRLSNCSVNKLIEKSINDSFNSGSGPSHIWHEATEGGIKLHSTWQHGDGVPHHKNVEWTIEDEVPLNILVRENDLTTIMTNVIKNAVRFTTNAEIGIQVRLDPTSRYILFRISDDGPGIRPEFQPKLFDPFSREDSSITRRFEGLGLGLLVAKGLAGKLGGDLNLIRSDTEGATHGSEFEIAIPITPSGMQTPASQTSAPGSVVGSHVAASTYRRRSSAASFHLRTGQIPPPVDYAPFGKLLTEPLTPSPSNQVSPQIGNVSEAAPAKIVASIASKEQEATKRTEHTPLTIMVADDNDIIRRTFVQYLVKLGHKRENIYQAHDGADAVRQVAELRGKHEEEVRQYGYSKTPPIDIILMDIWMPDVDGCEATKRILALYGPVRSGMRRAISAPNIVPLVGAEPTQTIATQMRAKHLTPPTILAITADATDACSAQAVQAGMQGFLAKPVNMQDLRRTLKEAEERRALADCC